MDSLPEFNLDDAIVDLRAEQERIKAATEHMSTITGSAVSKDRVVTATVDSQGRLVDLKLAGTRYRKLAPAELTASIVATVRQAQEDAAGAAATALSGLLPEGLGLPVGGELDLDAMFDAAVNAAKATHNSQEGTEGNG
jgi:DNA-binding protein YbaB